MYKLCIGLTLADFDQKRWLDLAKEVEEWDTSNFHYVNQNFKVHNKFELSLYTFFFEERYTR